MVGQSQNAESRVGGWVAGWMGGRTTSSSSAVERAHLIPSQRSPHQGRPEGLEEVVTKTRRGVSNFGNIYIWALKYFYRVSWARRNAA